MHKDCASNAIVSGSRQKLHKSDIIDNDSGSHFEFESPLKRQMLRILFCV